jgi:hypothetical protein
MEEIQETCEFRAGTVRIISGRLLMKLPQQADGLSRRPRMTFPQVVTPECLNRGSSPKFVWIPAKNMRE